MEVSVVGAMQDGRVIKNFLLLKVIKNATNILIYGDQPCVVVLGYTFERSAGNVR